MPSAGAERPGNRGSPERTNVIEGEILPVSTSPQAGPSVLQFRPLLGSTLGTVGRSQRQSEAVMVPVSHGEAASQPPPPQLVEAGGEGAPLPRTTMRPP